MDVENLVIDVTPPIFNQGVFVPGNIPVALIVDIHGMAWWVDTETRSLTRVRVEAESE